MWKPFNVMETSFFARDRLYRVYCDAQSLYFIRIGGQLWKEVEPNAMNQGGLVGGFMTGLAASERRMDPKRIAQMDKTPPSEVLGQHRHDKAVALDDVASASLEPWSFFRGQGSHVGRWVVTAATGKRWKFQFPETEEMGIAVEAVPAVLGDKVQVNVAWDEDRQRFVRA
jgi:hypothetical protein